LRACNPTVSVTANIRLIGKFWKLYVRLNEAITNYFRSN
jgi:hypothetical protein